jgi:hypothetical protein
MTAVDCPCGCGRTIGRMAKRTAERAVFIQSLSKVPEHLGELYKESDSLFASRMESFTRQGRGYADMILNEVHGDWAVGFPSSRNLRDWESQALRLAPGAKQADPEWFAEWPGLVRNRVTGKGSRQDPLKR